MRALLRFRILLIFSLLSLYGYQSNATHFRAGEITARRLPGASASDLTYEIKLTAYFDVTPAGINAANAANDVNFYFGSEGPVNVKRIQSSVVNIGNNTTINEYITTHRFPSAGKFQISVMMENRNANILNLKNGIGTDQVNFYVHSSLEINANFGLNQTPVMLNAPIDVAAVGQRYIHNPGAFDADGDSLSYKMFVPQRSPGNGLGIDIPYVDPNQVRPPGQTEAGASPATFSLNPITGDLIWDAPTLKGLYNVAFAVEEWRDGVLIGQIVRDMQIIVEDADNKRPVLEPLPDLCVEAGTLIRQAVKATDKDGNKLTLTSNGGIYESTLVKPALASFTVANQGALSTVTGQLLWQTGCDHIRLEPYEVLFKVEDGPATGNPAFFRKLADITTLNIRVYGPKPLNLKAVPATDPAGTAYRLTWDPYKCQVSGAKIIIYRSEGCKDIPEDVCITGIPAGSGYTEIARVGVGELTYLDNTGLEAGISYSYRLVVAFPRPGANPNEPGSLVGGGQSVASDESCLNLPTIMPVITHVTVDSTDTAKGVITVRWTRPTSLAGIPAQYRLMRATGQNGSVFTEVIKIPTQLDPKVADTLYVDKNLNTTANAYRYQIEYYTTRAGALALQDVTEPASSVRLEQGAADPARIRLNWSAIVPWSNERTVHRVYREDKARPGTFNRIDDVQVQAGQPFNYTDDGTDRFAADGIVNVTISKELTYCYKVETVGSYNNRQIKPDTLLNFSQIICVSASDTTKPCPPVLSIDPLDCAALNAAPETFCDQATFTNQLTWTYPQLPCDQNLTAYKIYYARYEGDPLTLAGTVTAPPIPLATSFAHEGLSSFAGCYYVTAVNGFGTESAPSNTVCKDNCPMYVLPNVFTPNGDRKNDVFRPFDCPAFVQSLTFRVFNRWGAQVYDTKDVSINWDGKNKSGKELSAGQYYYEAVIYFESASKDAKPTTLKGWVQLMR